MAKVPVNPDVLAWAREERGLGLEQAADLLAITPDELRAFENGDVQPSVSFLRKMAAKYDIGFSALLMPERLPDNTRLNVKDFRTHLSGKPEWSKPLLALLDNLDGVIDALADVKADAPDLFVKADFPSISITDDPTEVSRHERERIGPEATVQLGWGSDSIAFKHYRAFVESQGVFVYVMKAGSEAEWRGLSVIDDRGIPVIVINGSERNYAARNFSLFHEYCHILLRQTAISDESRTNKYEAFCNKFSAYFLMPPDVFMRLAEPKRPAQGQDWSDDAIKKLARKLKVSMSAVAIQLEDTGLAPAGMYERKIKQWHRPGKKPESGGPSEYAERVANKLGVKHVETVFAALKGGYIDQLDANELLFDVKPRHFAPIEKEVEERRAVYGGRR